ncbi:MAG TPA: SpoIID/LytB domain-containing protein [Thermoleophilaceae bacterium]|nr:SpoIID/LytB domain-containing protein [Thermoleophilaceae bacterium]
MRRIRLVLTALALFAAVPATADAAVRHVIRGAGFGHGIGMSQYGAYGYALEGAKYSGILGHYYKGTSLQSAPSRPVRVLLQPVDPYIRVRGATSVGGRALRPGTTYIAKRGGGGIVVTNSRGRRVGRFGSTIEFKSDDPIRLLGPALNSVSNGLYRGSIEVRVDGGGVTSINELDLDSYVRGVVAGEMPSTWPLEALKVQAVAARTYALATRRTDGVFDQYPDTRSQVYRGVTGESVRSDSAVEDTAGRIVTYGGQPAVTYYFSTSGGHTENVEFSFVGSLSKPWLVGVPDPYDTQSPYHRWTVRFSAASLDRRLGAPGAFRRIKVLERGVSPRVVSAQVVGTRGSRTMSGPQIRTALGLRDSWFTDYRVSSTASRARSARPASWGPRPTERVLAGQLLPAPHTRSLRVERRSGGSFRPLTRVRTTASGRYRLALNRPGVYRVRYGAVAGPPVRVR